MKQWFPESKIIANSLALTPQRFYVYKISLDSGHFYIGQTFDISSRLSQHMICINDNHFEHKGERLNFHIKAAELLCEQFGSNIQDVKDIKKFVFVHIIAIVDSRKYALAIERLAITDNIANELCLNTYM